MNAHPLQCSVLSHFVISVHNPQATAPNSPQHCSTTTTLTALPHGMVKLNPTILIFQLAISWWTIQIVLHYGVIHVQSNPPISILKATPGTPYANQSKAIKNMEGQDNLVIQLNNHCWEHMSIKINILYPIPQQVAGDAKQCCGGRFVWRYGGRSRNRNRQWAAQTTLLLPKLVHLPFPIQTSWILCTSFTAMLASLPLASRIAHLHLCTVCVDKPPSMTRLKTSQDAI